MVGNDHCYGSPVTFRFCLKTGHSVKNAGKLISAHFCAMQVSQIYTLPDTTHNVDIQSNFLFE